jgi:long-chain acyl-CoA synthetase
VREAPNSPCVGARSGDSVTNITYREVHEQALAIGSAILNRNLAPELAEYKQYRLRIVGVFAKNRPEWLILDVANALFNFVMSPLYDSLGQEAV